MLASCREGIDGSPRWPLAALAKELVLRSQASATEKRDSGSVLAWLDVAWKPAGAGFGATSRRFPADNHVFTNADSCGLSLRGIRAKTGLFWPKLALRRLLRV
jgi:hypothetical protein